MNTNAFLEMGENYFLKNPYELAIEGNATLNSLILPIEFILKDNLIKPGLIYALIIIIGFHKLKYSFMVT